ncbi:MAG TPA: electron transfer flavoprotein subunit beta/FixA family protein [Thermomicrobiales bacterium]|nr:electron transfer flavoprotein subunit beta/FixA family protein [Thermomicrobiales bacterium]
MPYQIAVLVKQVPDLNAMRIDSATGKPIHGGQMVISSYDDYAIEQAIELKESQGAEVTIVAAGPAGAKDAVSRALAMGADKGVLIEVAANDIDTRVLARVLADQLSGAGFDLILAGQSSDDTGTGQVGPQVAEYLGLPCVSSVIGLEANGSMLSLVRDTEDGKQKVSVETPVLVMASSGLNEPRYPSLKGIMAAKKKPIDIIKVDVAPSQDISWGEPFREERAATGTIVADVPAAESAAQLAAWLKEKKLV